MGAAPSGLHSRPVSSIRHRLRLFACFALVAMLGLALAPSVSHALSAQQASNPWTQICSSSASGEQSGGGAAMHLEHCALCCVAASAIGMPPALVALLPAPQAAARVAVPARAAAHARFAWRPPQARAPPPHS